MIQDKAVLLKLRLTFWTCFAFFVAGFYVWYRAEMNREAGDPYRQIKIPKSTWNPGQIFNAPKQIRVPFPRAVVTDIIGGDSFILSTGKKVKLVGVSIDVGDDLIAKEAAGLADRLVGKREIFFEYEPGYKHDSETNYIYLYFRIPIIQSTPQVGPEYVHWSLNAELLKLGLAKVDDSVPFQFLDKFRSYENEAKSQRKGLWRNL